MTTDLTSEVLAELRFEEWSVNPGTPSVILTPHGRISIGWSTQAAGSPLDFSLAERAAAALVTAVNHLPALLDAAEREAAARKRVEELETALRPFADAASYIDACDIVDAAPLSNEHFYAARAALSTSAEQEKG